MRFIALACCGLICAGGANVSAQNPIGPPGFAPAEDDSPIPGPPRESRTYSGSGDYPNSVVDPYSDTSIGPSRIPSDNPRPSRIFRQPVVPTLVLTDEPALPRIWFRAEGLYWWSKASPLPVPVVTQGSTSDTTPGALGQPGTSVLMGNQNIGIPGRGGSRFTFGFSFDPAQTWAFEASYFSLASSTTSQGVFSDGSPNSALLAFPFFNTATNREDASPIAFPGSFAGNAVMSSQTFLQGTDLNFIHNIANRDGIRIDLLGGFRYVNLQEGMLFTTESPNVGGFFPGFFNTFDQFNTSNNFYGGQVGARASYDVARFFVNATTKLAIGATSETVSINGGTFTNIGGFVSAPGAYLSQPTNIGSQTRDQFAVVPELNMNFGFRLRPWASIIVGYSFLYISSVARPGDQMQHTINPTQAPAINNTFPGNLTGAPLPGLTVRSTDFWAQGLNFTLEFRY